ncbi:hypothetical protein [Nitrosomonas communis]|uniref:hypothetical protein n=1 Tax=Nitrosomonas communis TaxID=44574 RepID=UPI0015A5F677|nr:hypothetical protein [Nitrosomonas communis]
MKCNFYKVNKRQAEITSELLEGILATLAELKSRHILAGRLPAKHAEGVTEKDQ